MSEMKRSCKIILLEVPRLHGSLLERLQPRVSVGFERNFFEVQKKDCLMHGYDIMQWASDKGLFRDDEIYFFYDDKKHIIPEYQLLAALAWCAHNLEWFSYLVEFRFGFWKKWWFHVNLRRFMEGINTKDIFYLTNWICNVEQGFEPLTIKLMSSNSVIKTDVDSFFPTFKRMEEGGSKILHRIHLMGINRW